MEYTSVQVPVPRPSRICTFRSASAVIVAVTSMSLMAAVCVHTSPHLFLASMRVPSAWSHSQSLVGRNFFSEEYWTFWTAPDPTFGYVRYVSRDAAKQMGLVNASDDRVYMSADRSSVLSDDQVGRPSVRIQSTRTFDHGLFVLTLDHMPTGCATWPAFWMYGDDATHEWPTWGEFDIIETTNRWDTVLTSLHTREGCEQTALVPGKDFLGSWNIGKSKPEANNCSVHDPTQFSNEGCQQWGNYGSAGEPFNAQGGGTFAAEWDPVAGHLRTWFWPMGSEPSGIASQEVNPSDWGTPYSFFKLGDNCDASHFQHMRLIFNIDFAGGWYDLDNEKYFAKECPDLAATGVSCWDYVHKHPEAMAEAYWSIRRLDIYQRA